MAQQSKYRSDPDKEKNGKEKNSFYESMPATWGIYPLDETEAESTPEHYQIENDDYKRTTKITAIITLVLSLLVAVALGVLFIRGIDTINNTAPTQSSGSLEM